MIGGLEDVRPRTNGSKKVKMKAAVTNKAGNGRSRMHPAVGTKNCPSFSFPQKFLLRPLLAARSEYCGYIKNWAHNAGPESKSYNILNGGRSILKLARGIFTPYRPNDLYL